MGPLSACSGSGFDPEALAESTYNPSLFLPESFLLYEPAEMPLEEEEEEGVVAMDEEVEENEEEEAVLVAVPLPPELDGVPVFRIDGRTVVFIAHLLSRILPCLCRANRHFGLFKDKKYGDARCVVDASQVRPLQSTAAYAAYSERYPVARLKNTAAAVTVEGLLKWHGGKMAVFVSREAKKCANKGCVKDKCTCPPNNN